MITFIEGGMSIPMGRVTQDYLINYRLTPHQCAPNLFRVLGGIDALNEQMGLGLMWHDVVHMYECHKLADVGYYLKSQSDIIRLISCLPKSNKSMKDDYLIIFREWHDGLHCPTRTGDLGGVPQVQVLRYGIQSLQLLLPFSFNTSPFFDDDFHYSNHDFLLGCFFKQTTRHSETQLCQRSGSQQTTEVEDIYK